MASVCHYLILSDAAAVHHLPYKLPDHNNLRQHTARHKLADKWRGYSNH